VKKITVSAPGKLVLFGEHAVVYGRPCIVTAMDQRIKVTIERSKTNDFFLDAPDVKIKNYRKPISDLGRNDIPRGTIFVEMALKNILNYIKYKDRFGFNISTKSEFSALLGFGSSSASTACIIKGISEILKVKITNKQIFDISYKTVMDIQKKGSGVDIAANIYGGTVYFVTGGKIIKPLNINNLPLIVGYSGIKADTVTILNQVRERFLDKPGQLNKIYDSIGNLVEDAKKALIKNDWEKAGNLMNKNQKYLSLLGVSIPKLDNMINAAIEAGAYGAKLSGAGGGDCMIAVGPENRRKEIE